MRKTIVTATVVLLAALTGCASEEPAPETSDAASPVQIEAPPSEEAEPTENSYDSATEYGVSDAQVDELFTSMLRTEFPSDFGPVDDDTLVGLGKAACSGLTESQSFATMVRLGVREGYSVEVVSSLLGFSIGAYCPENDYLLN